MRNCHSYRGTPATANLIWEGLECTTVILTGGILHFEGRILVASDDSHQLMRAQSGKAWNAQLAFLPMEYYTLKVESGMRATIHTNYCEPSLGKPGMRDCRSYRVNITL